MKVKNNIFCNTLDWNPNRTFAARRRICHICKKDGTFFKSLYIWTPKTTNSWQKHGTMKKPLAMTQTNQYIITETKYVTIRRNFIRWQRKVTYRKKNLSPRPVHWFQKKPLDKKITENKKKWPMKKRYHHVKANEAKLLGRTTAEANNRWFRKKWTIS